MKIFKTLLFILEWIASVTYFYLFFGAATLLCQKIGFRKQWMETPIYLGIGALAMILFDILRFLHRKTKEEQQLKS